MWCGFAWVGVVWVWCGLGALGLVVLATYFVLGLVGVCRLARWVLGFWLGVWLVVGRCGFEVGVTVGGLMVLGLLLTWAWWLTLRTF